MSDKTGNTRIFKGTVDSTSPAFAGLKVPATLTLIERDSDYECRFVFVVGAPLALTVIAPKGSGTAIKGTAKDPRGWDVLFVAELRRDRVIGSYNQPHDYGTFELSAVTGTVASE